MTAIQHDEHGPYVAVDGFRVAAPAVGSVVRPDGRLGERLLACEFPEFAPFRLPSAVMKAVTGCEGPACRVDVTGRKLVYRDDCYWVRVRITWVGDGEADTASGGWLLADRCWTL